MRSLGLLAAATVVVAFLAAAPASLPAIAGDPSLLPGSDTLSSLLGDDEADGSAGDLVFATAGPVALHPPSRHVELVGFHQASHRGARPQSPQEAGAPKAAMPSRGRGTGRHTAADVVAAPDQPVLAPVTGRVVRAGSYAMYCRHQDHFVVIAPDARPEWEVKVLHFEGLRVQRGDRVAASRTVLGTRPRALPFRSQVDDFSAPRDWPHLHVEVVDPSVPTPPGSC